jgi:hypothetical protein
MASLIQPLSSQVPIVDEEGKPLPSFITMLQKLGVGTGLDASTGLITLAAMAAKTILANKTAGVAAPTACTISDILDFVTSTRGSIIYRGAAGWAALAPGTSGNVLQTNGAGADPTWVTPAAGGGGENYEVLTATKPVAASFTLQNTGAGVTLADKTKGVLLNRDGTATGQISFASQNAAFSASTFTITARLRGTNPRYAGGYTACIVLRNSTNARLLIYGNYNSDTNYLVQAWTSYSAFSSNVVGPAGFSGVSTMPWRRVTLAAGTLDFQMSIDGEVWVSLGTTTVAAFLTAAGGGTLDQIGFGSFSNNNGTICHSWTVV